MVYSTILVLQVAPFTIYLPENAFVYESLITLQFLVSDSAGTSELSQLVSK